MYSMLTSPKLLDLFLINGSLIGLLIRSICISFLRIWFGLWFMNTFYTYIFFADIAGIVAWTLCAKPGPTFLIIYVIIILYYIKRFFDKKEIVKTIKEFFPDTKFIATSPTIKQN